MAKQEYLRWGIAGIGSGASNLLGGFERSPHVKVTAAADIRKEARRGLRPRVRLRDLLLRRGHV